MIRQLHFRFIRAMNFAQECLTRKSWQHQHRIYRQTILLRLPACSGLEANSPLVVTLVLAQLRNLIAC